ncbi:hypothetical protein Spa11_14330 [Botrimarina mediterranea]|uniref:Uncharacterized protein n=2 Tax=Botrimarina mediterranea TaxID=2528022 RepID=A0A518K634_9BACT|nr:hypothetical protein Spa11_14330 [Botrimarina mediterranea]
MSHDLHMASLFVAWRLNSLLDGFGVWRSGDWLRAQGLSREFGKNVPDAALLDGSLNVSHLIEGGGSYCVRKLQAIHQAYKSYPYSIY